MKEYLKKIKDRKLVRQEVSKRTLPSYLVDNQHHYSQFIL